MAQLSIVIPCYNEEGNLHALIAKCKEVIQSNTDVEIILVNNGSKDRSQQIMDELLNGNTNIRSHHVKVNQGYGFGILAGLQQATADVLCWTHADLQTDIFDCLKAFEIYKAQSNPYLMVKGRRKGRAFFDVLFTSLMSYYAALKLGSFISDINAQPKLFSSKFHQEIEANAPADFSLDLYFLLHAKKKGTIVEFPVDFSQRTAGEAKGGSGDIKLKIKLSKRTLNFINKFPKS
jgi:glycosyltransferase involved in cell wall biosynthesis